MTDRGKGGEKKQTHTAASFMKPKELDTQHYDLMIMLNMMLTEVGQSDSTRIVSILLALRAVNKIFERVTKYANDRAFRIAMREFRISEK